MGENNLGRRVVKEVWGINWGREVIIKIVRGSLRLRYVCERWRRGVRIIMRKPNKLDYGLLSSYRVINLLDVMSKVAEKLVARRLEMWGQVGMGNEQDRGRMRRSSLDRVGCCIRVESRVGRRRYCCVWM